VLPKSPVSSSQNAVVPHINIRSPRLQPGKLLIDGAKRLLQQNLPLSEVKIRIGSPGENRPAKGERYYHALFMTVCAASA
jgi:hypothetical protein